MNTSTLWSTVVGLNSVPSLSDVSNLSPLSYKGISFDPTLVVPPCSETEMDPVSWWEAREHS